jgi:hypothetical protein
MLFFKIFQTSSEKDFVAEEYKKELKRGLLEPRNAIVATDKKKV